MTDKDTLRSNRYQDTSPKTDLLNTGSALITIGFMLAVFSLLADIIGYGTWGEFGLLQTIGTIVGIMFVMIGLIIKILANIFS